MLDGTTDGGARPVPELIGDSTTTVVFDLDDTLIVESRSARSSMRRVASDLLPGLDPGEVEQVIVETARGLFRAGPHYGLCERIGVSSWEGLWSSFTGCHPMLAPLELWAPSYRDETWRAVIERLGANRGLIDEIGARYAEYQRAAHPLVDGAAVTVRALSRSYELGLLTNGPSDIQRIKLAGAGLSPYFAAVAISGEMGTGKPAPEAFEGLLERLGATAAAAVMVGDSWERDVLGARTVGMRAVWVSGGRPLPEERSDVGVVESVREFVTLPT